MTELYLKSIEFNEGTKIDLKEDDIVVFVGPNNAGKTRALHDVYNLVNKASDGIVVKDVEVEVKQREAIDSFIKDFSIEERGGSKHYRGLNYDIYPIHIQNFVNNSNLENSIKQFLVSWIGTAERLNIVRNSESIGSKDPVQHPIHYLVKDSAKLKMISDRFNEAFGDNLQLNTYAGKQLPLVIGKLVEIDNRAVGQRADLESEFLRREFDKLPRLEDQGDGMKSFAGIMLYLLVTHYSAFFVDEPESFLHPPQAYVMGKVMGEMSEKKQLFITTHSETLLKGLLESAPNRVRVIRITRDGNDNHISQLDRGGFDAIWSDPLLRYSNVMESLFYPATVVCEADADCKFYRMILDAIKREKGEPLDTLFVDTSGKGRLKTVCSALQSLGIKFRVIPDFDILRKDEDAEGLYNSCGGDWDADCVADWVAIDSFLPPYTDELDKDRVKVELNNYLDSLSSPNMSEHDVETMKGLLKGKSKWDGAKEKGFAGIRNDAEDESANEKALAAAKMIDEKFRAKGIYMVPSGEMESLVDGVSRKSNHGNGWLKKVLKKYPEITYSAYDKAKDFVREWGL